jgi:serine beta-lactamase-like protein LACTB, mitochondrial
MAKSGSVVLRSVIALAVAIFFAFFILATVTRVHPEVAAIPSAVSVPPSSHWANAVQAARKLARSALADGNLPGVSIAVGAEGQLVWAEAFGYADLKTRTPVTPQHQFRLGTASPLLTSVAVNHLVARGALALDREIQDYLPGIPRGQRPMTLRRLMYESTGGEAEVEGSPLFTRRCGQASDALRFLSRRSLDLGVPNTHSGAAWILVSAAMESATGQPFQNLMGETVIRAAGMHDTGLEQEGGERDDDFPLVNLFLEKWFDPRTASWNAAAFRPQRERVINYFPRYAANPNYGLHALRPLGFSCYAGAAAFLSTPSDLVKLGLIVGEGGLANVPAGSGWRSRTLTLAGRPVRALGGDGEVLGGQVATLLIVPEFRLSLAVMANVGHANTAGLAANFADLFAMVAGPGGR